MRCSSRSEAVCDEIYLIWNEDELGIVESFARDPELFEDEDDEEEEEEEEGWIGWIVRAEIESEGGVVVEVELVQVVISRGCEPVKVEFESVVESELDPLDLLLLLDVMTKVRLRLVGTQDGDGELTIKFHSSLAPIFPHRQALQDYGKIFKKKLKKNLVIRMMQGRAVEKYVPSTCLRSEQSCYESKIYLKDHKSLHRESRE